MSDEFNRNKSHCWKSIFHCCFRTASTNSGRLANESNSYEYIVEKLVIKRVPLSAFRMHYNIQKLEDTQDSIENITLTRNVDKVKFQSLLATSKSPDTFQSNLHNQVMTMDSQVSKINQEIPLIHNIMEDSPVESIPKKNETEILDVRAITSNIKENFEKEYIGEKIFAPLSFPCYKVDNISNPSINQNNLKARSENIEIDRDLSHTKQPRIRSQTSEKIENIVPKTDFVISPVEVHYESPNLCSIRKHIEETEPTIYEPQSSRNEKTFRRDSSHYRDECFTEESSVVSDNYKRNETAGTTLRWKIIIKHQPEIKSENQDRDLKLSSLANTSQTFKKINTDEDFT